MLSLFKSKNEKELGVQSFLGWSKRIHAAGRNFVLYNQLNKQMLAAYYKLKTPEQRLYAAYTSFSSNLKTEISDELQDISPWQKRSILSKIYNLFEMKEMHGCSHLLKQDYAVDFEAITEQKIRDDYERLPKGWLKEPITISQLAENYQSLYDDDIENHANNSWSETRDGLEWQRIINLLQKRDYEIWTYDSGFCRGFALVEDGQTIANVTTMHYSRR